MIVQIGCIVEGFGEVEAVPILIRRIAASLYPELRISIPNPIRVPRNKVVKEDELERVVEITARKIRGTGAIFVLLDSDDDCPARLGPELRHRALQTRGDMPIAVVLAKHEFESWFLASAKSLRGQRGLKDNIQPPGNPETVRGAKGWLSRQMTNRSYRETLDQPKLTARFDFGQARRLDSFDKCYRDIVCLLDELRKSINTT